MPERKTGTLDRRNVLKVLGVSGLAGLTGYAGAASGKQPQDPQPAQAADGDEDDDDEMFEQIPALDIPVIDAYYNGEKVWFIHTSASTQQMATQLQEMIHSPVLHVPALDDMVDLDALAPIYVFRNGIDRSNAEPWGGGPFGFQIDILDSVPGDEDYTPLRRPNVVTWNEDADPRILESVEELMEAEEAGDLSIQRMDVVVNAPVVDWPGGSLGGIHMNMGPSMMQDMCEMQNRSEMCDDHDKPGTSNSDNSSTASGINNGTSEGGGEKEGGSESE